MDSLNSNNIRGNYPVRKDFAQVTESMPKTDGTEELTQKPQQENITPEEAFLALFEFQLLNTGVWGGPTGFNSNLFPPPNPNSSPANGTLLSNPNQYQSFTATGAQILSDLDIAVSTSQNQVLKNTVKTGKGNDTINVFGNSDSAIFTDSGNDDINLSVQGGLHTVDGGQGNDVINLSAKGGLHTFRAGQGNDSSEIGGTGSSLNLNMGDGTDYTEIYLSTNAYNDGSGDLPFSNNTYNLDGGKGSDHLFLSCQDFTFEEVQAVKIAPKTYKITTPGNNSMVVRNYEKISFYEGSDPQSSGLEMTFNEFLIAKGVIP
jgi:hypothetical protein